MPRNKTECEKQAGKLISAIQKVWGAQAGEPEADDSERVMDLAHELLQAQDANKMSKHLSGKSVAQYIGEIWLQKHPEVKPIVNQLDREISKNA